MPRLFVAIELDAAVKRVLISAQKALRRFDSMVRWTGESQMHLTLKFLGEVPDGNVPRICEALAVAAEELRVFELAATSGGCYPPKGRVRTVWVGIENVDGHLMECQRTVEAALDAADYPPESRPFSAHLTLGRVKTDTSAGRLRSAVETLNATEASQQVDKIVLMESQLSSTGAKHTPLGAWTLGSQ